MKKIFLAMATIMICAANSMAQDLDEVFSKFQNTTGVTVLNVDKELIKKGFKWGDSGDKNAGEINIGPNMEGAELDNVRILVASEAQPDIMNNLRHTLQEMNLEQKGYEPIVKHNGEDTKVTILGIPDGGIFSQLVVLVDEGGKIIVVKADGRIDMKKLMSND